MEYVLLVTKINVNIYHIKQLLQVVLRQTGVKNFIRGIMKVQKIVTNMEEIEFTGATLLSIEEADELPLRLRQYNNWWWLRSCGCGSDIAAVVNRNGFVDFYGYTVDHCYNMVRPALKITNLKSSNFEIGDVFIFGNKMFEVISEKLAFCVGDIGECCFQEDWHAKDANDYEKSDVKKFVDEWFEEACK